MKGSPALGVWGRLGLRLGTGFGGRQVSGAPLSRTAEDRSQGQSIPLQGRASGSLAPPVTSFVVLGTFRMLPGSAVSTWHVFPGTSRPLSEMGVAEVGLWIPESGL